MTPISKVDGKKKLGVKRGNKNNKVLVKRTSV